jgi:hypothetical protein
MKEQNNEFVSKFKNYFDVYQEKADELSKVQEMRKWPREVSEWNVDLDKFIYLQECKKLSNGLGDPEPSLFYKIYSLEVNYENVVPVNDLLSKNKKEINIK